MFAGSAMPVQRPSEWRSNSYQHTTKSAITSPAGSRRSSVSSIASAQTEPGLISDRSRNSSLASTTASTTSTSTTKSSGFKSLFGKKEKKPKEKKDVDKIILTSKHAAAVKTAMMLDPNYQKLSHRKAPPSGVQTAGVVGTQHTGHLTAAQQEARHPHSGPPSLPHRAISSSAVSDMPLLTRIASGDERDEEDELDRLERARVEWDLAKVPKAGFARIREHESMPNSADVSDNDDDADDDNNTDKQHHHHHQHQYTVGDDVDGINEVTRRLGALNPPVERVLVGGEPRRPLPTSRNSYGTRFRRDESGCWKR